MCILHDFSTILVLLHYHFSTILVPLFGWFLVHYNGEIAFLEVRFSEKAPRVDSNPRATSAVLSGHLVSGGNHYTTAAVAG